MYALYPQRRYQGSEGLDEPRTVAIHPAVRLVYSPCVAAPGATIPRLLHLLLERYPGITRAIVWKAARGTRRTEAHSSRP